MKPMLTVVLVVAALASPLLAEEGDERAAGLARGKTTLAKLETADPALFGTQCFGMYLKGVKSIGIAKVTLAAAPEGSGAAYLTVMELELVFGPQKMSGKLEALLDATFALLARSSVEVREMVEGRLEKKETNRRDGAEWVYEAEISGGNGKVAHRLATSEPDHWMVPSLMTLARKLGLGEAGTLILRGIHWPKPEEADEPPPAVKDIVATVGGAEKVVHRGAGVEARRIRFAKGDDEVVEVVIDAAGRVLSVTQSQVPLVLVAGTEEECRTDLPAPDDGIDRQKGAASPKEAVMTYLRVLAKELPASALEGLLLWPVLHEEMSAEREEIAKLSLEEFKGALIEGFGEQAAGFTPEQLAEVEPGIVAKEEGDEATVTIPTVEENPFRVRRTADGWKIAHFPH
jgi:hypothetical protein